MKRYILTAVFLITATIMMAQIKVEPPVLVAPNNAATNQMPDLLLDWNAVIGAVKYELQLSEDAGFTDIVLDSITDVTAIKASLLKFTQQYHWRVRSLYEGNISSNWSDARSFTIFTKFDLFRPNDNATNQVPDANLQWRDRVGANPITGVSYFEIQIDTVNTFDSPELHDFTVASGIFEKRMANLLFGTKYFWKVRTGHENSISNWSDVRSFTTVNAVVPQRPNNNSLNNDLNTNFRWEAITGIAKYEYQVDVDADFSAPMVELTENNIEPAKNLFYGTQYFWRVRARHTRDTTNWSPVWNFTTFTSPALTFPADADTGIVLRPQLRWGQIKGTIKYEVNLSKDQSTLADHKFYKDASDAELPHLNVAPDLEVSTVYYWRVRAMSAIDTSDFSPVWSFTTAAPVGINEYFGSSEVSIYPNPAKSMLNLSINSHQFANVELVIYDLLGQVVVKQNLLIKSGLNENHINVNDLSNGIYMLKMMNGEQVFTKKIVISK